jgi:hypothetical protein
VRENSRLALDLAPAGKIRKEIEATSIECMRASL